MTQHDDEREALAALISDAAFATDTNRPSFVRGVWDAADAILTAGFRRSPTITEEMIELAAKSAYEEDINLHYDDEVFTVWWDDLSDSGRDLERRRARAALTAALGDGDE